MRNRRYVKEREGRKGRPSDIVRLEGKNLSKVPANELRELLSSLPAACSRRASSLLTSVWQLTAPDKHVVCHKTQVLALCVTSDPQSVTSLT